MNSKEQNKTNNSDDWRSYLFIVIAIFALIVGDRIARMSPEAIYQLKMDLLMMAMLIGSIATYYVYWRMGAPLRARRKKLWPIMYGPKRLSIGRTPDGFELGIPSELRTGHVQITGATGRGKSQSVIAPWGRFDIESGHDVILIDGKGDYSLWEKMAGPMFFNPESMVFNLASANAKVWCRTIVTNPLLYGSAQQITDRLFAAFEFEDSYYRAVQYSLIGLIIKLIHERGEGRGRKKGVVTFRKLYDLLTDDVKLSDLAATAKSELDKRKILTFLGRRREDRIQDISGFLSQIEPFAIGEVSTLVNAEGFEPGFISISRLVLGIGSLDDDRIPEYFKWRVNHKRVYGFLLPTHLYQKIAHQLGKLLLQELGWAIGERETGHGQKSFLPVYLDEFSGFVYDGFENILNKARSANVAFHLSHQSLGDLKKVSPEFASVINANTNIKCILGVNDPDTAEHFARHFGTKTDTKTTERASRKGIFNSVERTGDMSIREVESYKAHPNELKHFTDGRGVVHVPFGQKVFSEVVTFHRIEDVEEMKASGDYE